MKKEFIKSNQGYDIPCLHNISGNEKLVVIIIHEFRSAKFTPTTKALMPALAEQGIGSCCFDFPGHDESPVQGDKFLIENCLNDLSTVENYVKALAPDAEIAYFASSFGAYITLIYFATRTPLGTRACLRCAATDMAGIIERSAAPEAFDELNRNGFIMIDKGPLRPLKFMKELYEDFKKYDLLKTCKTGMGDFIMIHGSNDKTAPLDEAKNFAETFDIPLIIIPGTDHFMFNPPETMDTVVKEAVQFFTKKQ